MAQFDVYRLVTGDVVLDIQSEAFGHLRTRVVVPLLMASNETPPESRLTPILQVAGVSRIMMTYLIATILANTMRTNICSVTNDYLRIEAALDTLIGNY
ncbi:CcdB family protein [Sphingomonas sp. R86521]|uniref:CcdB family protein n=1 Tax=Sphingomonas sp. R86521 TaxID=3093860 RepID=UPI0036D30C01